MTDGQANQSNTCTKQLEEAQSYSEIWQIVKDTVEFSMHKRRGSMMLFLDDLPLGIGAYYPVGTNNIVLNRALVEMAEASGTSRQDLNSFIYNLLLHEYLHALGELSEEQVRHQVIKIAEKCFGKQHAASVLARESPWALLKKVPLHPRQASKRALWVVSDFEKVAGKYVV